MIMTRDFFEHQSRTLNALYEVSRVLGSSLDLGLVARRCLRALSDNLDLERGILLMPTSDRTDLAIKANFGLSPEEQAIVFPIQGGFLGKVYTTGMPIVVTDPSMLEEVEAEEIRKLTPTGGAPLLVAVPVTLDRRCVGVLVANRSPHSATMIDEDLKVIRRLPLARLEAVKLLVARVDCGSLIHVDRNAYSVNSRLIGQKVEVRLYVQHLEVWYGQKKVEELPRLRGRNQHRVNYRHVIDWLVRKPGAFAGYRYQADLFPSSLFRVAYDRLKSQCAGNADKQYLKILELAARESQSLVEAAIGHLADLEQAMSFETVEALVQSGRRMAAPTVVRVDEVDLSAYDQLLDGEAASLGLGVGHE